MRLERWERARTWSAGIDRNTESVATARPSRYRAQPLLQVVVALLAFGLLVGASGSAAAAFRIEGQVQASGSPLANSTVTLWQSSAHA